jgi:cytochrome oxidase Cu insertion factor (SCO1/SenC/PrrC family)
MVAVQQTTPKFLGRRARLAVYAGVAGASAVVLAMAGVGSSGSRAPMTAAPGAGLVDQRGEPFDVERLRGKTVVLNFIFTHCPGVCPLQTQALQRVRSALPEEVRERVRFVSVSVDPGRDTPAALSAFAAKHAADTEHWTFVTGPERELRAFSESYSAQALPEGASPLDHRTEVRVINARGQLMQTYTGNPLDAPRLEREIQTVDALFGAKTPR